MGDAFQLFALVARTATANSADQSNARFRGVRLYLVISAASGTSPTLDVKIQSKDPVGGGYIDMPSAAFAQQTDVQTGIDLVVYPGIAETANRSVSDVIPERWRIAATIGGTNTPSFTYSVAGHYLD